jgi:hypothetical protein
LLPSSSFSFRCCCSAQDSTTAGRSGSAPIQDNSFLVEEAYNQEDGVVQHISSFERLTNSHDWVYTQTDEWPLRSLRHQVSITLAGTHSGSFAGSGAGWGDTALNYRYQLLGSGETKFAIAPRVSVMLPSGDHRYGRGSGGLGMQMNLPVSVQHSRRLSLIGTQVQHGFRTPSIKIMQKRAPRHSISANQ